MMMDQAENLRNRLKQQNLRSVARTIAVISGKGGVGKSNFSLNFAITLSKKGHSVLLFDMDIGMGNIDILMGNISGMSIIDFFEYGKTLKEIISSGPENVSVIAGGTGLTKLFELEEQLFDRFLEEFNGLLGDYDYIIFDMGAGINDDSTKFMLCVDDLIVITTPEPTAVMDAYSAMKYLNSINQELPFFLVCNRVLSDMEGQETVKRIQNALHKFLQKEIIPLGFLPDDKSVSKAVTNQIPFVLYNSESIVSKSLLDIVARYEAGEFKDNLSLKKSHFLGKLKSYFVGR
ncbi:MinD/ParA family protein [Bacillus sp. CECT 9360]|uniref:MinD/ParA family protein n=1 Tax=Bacillus sp. CECT 9360 TaxID=2845821 RepID=UPI001E3DF55E|nr:MinD/ParA family protein [Bacillus sp. CECT 9360]CAH0346172.1 Flagellum site-determining protein YlxH [Bacillus sp. CECT 9360]